MKSLKRKSDPANAAPAVAGHPAVHDVRDDSSAGMITGLGTILALASVILFLSMVVGAALFVFVQSDASISSFAWEWRPAQGKFGILNMCAGSLLLASFALLVGYPLALGLTCWLLAEESPYLSPLVRFVRGLVKFMTTIPTVIYGFAAVFLLTPLVRAGSGGTGMCLLTAGIMLTLLILPTIVLVIEGGLAPRLDHLCPGGLALGFSRLDLLRLFVLPKARRNLVAAAILGFGRAVGDTLIPLMLAGNAIQLPHGLGESLRTLSAHMALVTANEVGGSAYNSLFIAGFILLLVNVTASLVLRGLGIRKKGRRSFPC